MVDVSRGRLLDAADLSPVSSAQVMIYDATGKLHSTLTTNVQGEFPTSFPKGEYGITVHAPGYVLDPEASFTLKKNAEVVYDGGTFVVKRDDEPIDMIVPVQKSGTEKKSNAGILRSLWGTLQFAMNKKSHIEHSSYGLVRDSITKAPLDLAVIRLFDEKTGQLVETRISDIYGKFSLFPSPGTYKMTIVKEGYNDVVREHVEVLESGESALFDPIDLTIKGVL